MTHEVKKEDKPNNMVKPESKSKETNKITESKTELVTMNYTIEKPMEYQLNPGLNIDESSYQLEDSDDDEPGMLVVDENKNIDDDMEENRLKEVPTSSLNLMQFQTNLPKYHAIEMSSSFFESPLDLSIQKKNF